MKSSKPGKSTVLKRSIVIGGHKTSMSLEDEFWNALREIAKERGSTVGDLVKGIEAGRQNTNLSSVVRVFVLRYFQNQIAASKRPTPSE
jgi:predicted DNA-binding ribbon-helix-helix protein